MMSVTLAKKRFNVIMSIATLWILNLLLYFIFTQFVRVTHIDNVMILLFSFILFAAVTAFFMVKIDWLKDINTGKEINTMNISNILSTIRFTLIPMLIIMFGITMRGDTIYPEFDSFKVKLSIFIFSGLVCFTDAFDGYFARKFNEVTKIGQILDPFGDFLMITCFSILIFSQGMMKWWFFLLVMIRIPGLILLMVLYPLFKIKFKIISSFLGKLTIAFLLFFLGYSLCGLFFKNSNFSFHSAYMEILLLLQIIGSAVMIVSFIEKGVLFYRYWKNIG